MGAIWMRVRSDLRSRWRSAAALVLMIGLAGGVVMTSAAGARRTDTAYSRFLEWSDPPDAGVLIGNPFGSTFGFVGLSHEKLAALPEVASSELSDSFNFVPTTESGRYLFIGQGSGNATPSARALRFLGRPKILEGRMFDPHRVHEIVVGWGTAHQADVHPGDRVLFRFVRRDVNPEFLNTINDFSQAPKGVLTAPFTATIAGIVFFPGDVGDNAYGDVEFTPAFDRAFRDRLANSPGLSVRLRHGAADAKRFEHDASRLAHGGNVGSGTTASTIGPIRRATHPQAVALWLFAGLAALASILIFGQALARQVFLDALDNTTLRAMGMSRGQLFGVAIVRASVVAASAALLAVGVAVAASPFMPIGLARVMEPDPGISVDGEVIGLVAIAIVLTVMVIAAIPAWRTVVAAGSEVTSAEPSGRARPSAVAGLLSRVGLGPPAVAGTRMALEPGRGRTAVPVRSALGGTALAVTALTAAITFGGSFQHLFDTPRLYGWSWDAAVGNPYIGDISKRVLPTLPDKPYVGAVAGGNVLASLEVVGPDGSVGVNAFGLDQVKGSVHPPIVSGRWPQDSDEVALGTKTIRSVGARVGGIVDLRSGDNTLRHLRVVGRAVFVDVGSTGLGEGAGLTFQALRTLKPRAPENVFIVRFASGVDLPAARRDIRHDYPGTIARASDEVSGLGDLRPVRGLPFVLAALLALAGVATVAHALVTSIRRKRRDLAILKTLGFVRRQVSTTVAWQATTLVAIALLLGVPLGVAAGRWAWGAFADALGVVPESVVPAFPVLLVVPATLLLANLIALIPGRLAGRVRAAETLRTE